MKSWRSGVLSWQSASFRAVSRIERALAPHELRGLPRRLARARRLDDLLDDLARRRGGSIQVGAELLVEDLLDPGIDLGGDELVLRLRGELGS